MHECLATVEVRMISGREPPTSLQESGMVTPSKILQTLRFKGFAVFHQRLQHFRDSRCTRCYTAFIKICRMYERPNPHKGKYAFYVDGGIRPSHACLRVISSLYDARGLLFLHIPFLAPTPTCIVQHPKVRWDGSYHSLQGLLSLLVWRLYQGGRSVTLPLYRYV